MDLHHEINSLFHRLRRDKRARFNRRVPLGDLLTDRWENAADCGFGEGTSCYDNVLIFGDVKVGRHCWIGPNVILDGSGGGLLIGDHVDISAGVQIYTHDTMRRVLSGGKEPISYAPTRLGSCIYIGPNTIIQRGVTIGDRAVIGAMSLVRSDVPPGARAWGIPARVVQEAASGLVPEIRSAETEPHKGPGHG